MENKSKGIISLIDYDINFQKFLKNIIPLFEANGLKLFFSKKKNKTLKKAIFIAGDYINVVFDVGSFANNLIQIDVKVSKRDEHKQTFQYKNGCDLMLPINDVVSFVKESISPFSIKDMRDISSFSKKIRDDLSSYYGFNIKTCFKNDYEFIFLSNLTKYATITKSKQNDLLYIDFYGGENLRSLGIVPLNSLTNATNAVNLFKFSFERNYRAVINVIKQIQDPDNAYFVFSQKKLIEDLQNRGVSKGFINKLLAMIEKENEPNKDRDYYNHCIEIAVGNQEKYEINKNERKKARNEALPILNAIVNELIKQQIRDRNGSDPDRKTKNTRIYGDLEAEIAPQAVAKACIHINVHKNVSIEDAKKVYETYKALKVIEFFKHQENIFGIEIVPNKYEFEEYLKTLDTLTIDNIRSFKHLTKEQDLIAYNDLENELNIFFSLESE